MYSIKEIEFQEWEKQWQKCLNVNMLQSWQYGDAKEAIEDWKAHRFIILDENGESIALMQVLVKKILIFGIIARINRGPLIIGQIKQQHNQELIAINTITALINESSHRGWRMLQIAPELCSTKVILYQLRKLGLRQLSAPAWASGLLSLKKSEDELLMNLNGKWRNCLRKGLRSEISIKNSNVNTHNIQKLLHSYKKLKQEKKFSGISESLLENLAKKNDNNWKFNLFFASVKESDQPIGTLVSVSFGNTAIYLIGTTSTKGRKLNANYILIWEAILNAKNEGCSWFDIGGLDKTTPAGIAHFKKGLNADSYQLIGEWRLFNFPWKRNK